MGAATDGAGETVMSQVVAAGAVGHVPPYIALSRALTGQGDAAIRDAAATSLFATTVPTENIFLIF
jgi:hypothetical protein